MDSYATTLVHAAAAASRTRSERKGKSAAKSGAKEARKARARRSKKLTAAAGETTAETGAESPQLEVDEPDELPEAEPALSARDRELQKEAKMTFGWKTRAEPSHMDAPTAHMTARSLGYFSPRKRQPMKTPGPDAPNASVATYHSDPKLKNEVIGIISMMISKTRTSERL